MNGPEPGAAAPFTLERRSLPGSLRYLAGKLTGGTDPVHVAITLEMLAAKLDSKVTDGVSGPDGTTQIRATHPHAFRSGQWAALRGRLAALPVKGEDRDCYLVEFSDGETVLWPVSGAGHGYEFRAGEDAP